MIVPAAASSFSSPQQQPQPRLPPPLRRTSLARLAALLLALLLLLAPAPASSRSSPLPDQQQLPIGAGHRTFFVSLKKDASPEEIKEVTTELKKEVGKDGSVTPVLHGLVFIVSLPTECSVAVQASLRNRLPQIVDIEDDGPVRTMEETDDKRAS